MSLKPDRILLTGMPGCGKTTTIIKIVEKLRGIKAVGFYTQEIREGSIRKGFSWNSLDGAVGILAHVDTKSGYRVGKYGVDIPGFEEHVVPILDISQSKAELFIIDEIGKMECFSKNFITAVHQLFASDRSVLATVARKGGGLISEVKNYPDVKLFNLTVKNRDKTIAEISQILSFLKNPDK